MNLIPAQRPRQSVRNPIKNPLFRTLQWWAPPGIESNSLLTTTGVRGEIGATATIATVATLPVLEVEQGGGPLAWDEDPNALAYLDARGELIIPTDCPKKIPLVAGRAERRIDNSGFEKEKRGP